MIVVTSFMFGHASLSSIILSLIRLISTDLNNSTTRYHPVTALTVFVHYNSACRPLLSQSGLRGGRVVRAVGVATLNANSVKKAKYQRKK